MIAMLRGTVMEKDAAEAVLMAGGVGFRLLCSANTVSRLPQAGSEATVYTYLSVREDAMELYGFLTKEERTMFRSLIGVSGIGPRSALFVLGSMPLSDLRLAILTGDTVALSRAPGVGKKTAQRIALELRDKLAKDALSDESAFAATDLSGDAPVAHDAISEAMQALRALGYTPQEATAALKGVKGQADTADGLIRLALQKMVQTE